MGDIKGSFVQRQVQQLNQITPQQAPRIASNKPTDSNSTIGNTEFQARKAQFEKQVPKASPLGSETIGMIENRLEQVSSQELRANFNALKARGLVPQQEDEGQEQQSSESQTSSPSNQSPSLQNPAPQLNPNPAMVHRGKGANMAGGTEGFHSNNSALPGNFLEREMHEGEGEAV